MKFHLHVVDGNAASSSSTAACASENSAVLLFAHITLRCGHLADVVAVSASTTPAAARQAQLLQQAHGTAASLGGSAAASAMGGTAAHVNRSAIDATENEDTKVLQAAGAVLTGAVDAESEEASTLPYASLADGEHTLIRPYAYFTTAFVVAEQSLRQAIAAAATAAGPPGAAQPTAPPPYFDLIATTDMATFDYILDYYQQLRVRYGGSVFGCGGGGRGTKPVGVLHIVAEDPSRAARVLQRVLEMVLKRSGLEFSVDANAEEDAAEAMAAQRQQEEEGEQDRFEEEEGHTAGAAASAPSAAGAVSRAAKAESWANHIDEAVRLFAQLFGVDVLVALV
ncbi:hypothetical protein ABL78_4002 [Leptomonas seymouri]|uniref:Uncharacterized protein n=1 Tax=Leptomonas seymouri TaxID=5684 RepID=A0A0N0P5X0_LEPSE|nr:hypothetical protein ABL78_4002 [Leptomonas seymouri]|eukprot:KPI86956.1 hypothetical protein ABL78_4002 [Leptomonas seymouri]